MQKGECIALVAEVDGRVVAHGEIRRHGFRESHVGTPGISVSSDYRDGGNRNDVDVSPGRKGTGGRSETDRPPGVRGHRRAIHVYKKIGFKIKGRIPGKLAYKDRYSDAILMAKEIVS